MGYVIDFPVVSRIPSTEAASLASDCETYRVLLDDMLARLDALRCADMGWGDTVEIWLADARRLISEINANVPLVRVAQQVASRLGPLRFALEAMERQRPHDIREPDRSGEAALIAEARSVNDDLKSRLIQPPTFDRAAAIPSLLPTGNETGGASAGQAMPIIAERTSLQRLGDEACSAIFHGAEVLHALGAMALLGLAVMRRSVRRLLSHVGFLHHAKSVGKADLSVIRNDRARFRPHPGDGFPGGGSAA